MRGTVENSAPVTPNITLKQDDDVISLSFEHFLAIQKEVHVAHAYVFPGKKNG